MLVGPGQLPDADSVTLLLRDDGRADHCDQRRRPVGLEDRVAQQSGHPALVARPVRKGDGRRGRVARRHDRPPARGPSRHRRFRGHRPTPAPPARDGRRRWCHRSSAALGRRDERRGGRRRCRGRWHRDRAGELGRPGAPAGVGGRASHRPLRRAAVGGRRWRVPRRGHRGGRRVVAGPGHGAGADHPSAVGPAAPTAAGPSLPPGRRRADRRRVLHGVGRDRCRARQGQPLPPHRRDAGDRVRCAVHQPVRDSRPIQDCRSGAGRRARGAARSGAPPSPLRRGAGGHQSWRWHRGRHCRRGVGGPERRGRRQLGGEPDGVSPQQG